MRCMQETVGVVSHPEGSLVPIGVESTLSQGVGEVQGVPPAGGRGGCGVLQSVVPGGCWQARLSERLAGVERQLALALARQGYVS